MRGMIHVMDDGFGVKICMWTKWDGYY